MRIAFIMLLCIAAMTAEAQTYYYALTKVVYRDGRTETKSGNSGQFVKRTSEYGSKVCFDCTRSGRDHLNGMLHFVSSENGREMYKGPSYYGNYSTYVFYDSRGILNIKDATGNTYVYKRATPPEGRTRSSLIKEGGAADGWDVKDHWVDPTPAHNNPSTDKNKPGHDKGKQPARSSSRTCGYCHGNKRVKAHVGVSGYGVRSRKKKCTVCGVTYYVSEDHWHTCPHCKGTGRQ